MLAKIKRSTFEELFGESTKAQPVFVTFAHQYPGVELEHDWSGHYAGGFLTLAMSWDMTTIKYSEHALNAVIQDSQAGPSKARIPWGSITALVSGKQGADRVGFSVSAPAIPTTIKPTNVVQGPWGLN